MKNRSVVSVLLLSFVTLGIYELFWFRNTKNEMNSMGAKAPSAILMILPIVYIYFLLCYAEAVELVTGGKMTKMTAFLFCFFLGPIGAAIIQDAFNKMGTVPAMPASTPISTETLPIDSASVAPIAPVAVAQAVSIDTFNQVVSPAPQDEMSATVAMPVSDDLATPSAEESNPFQAAQEAQVNIESFTQPEAPVSTEGIAKAQTSEK
jgi:hypothetical protein